MSLIDRARSGVKKSVAWCGSAQDAQGRWMGSLRSNCCLWYAAGLSLLGEPRDSPVIANICDYFESCVNADGGLGPYPGEPSTPVETATTLPLLVWAGRSPATVAAARGYLEKNGPEYHDPATEWFHYVFEPDKRQAIFSDRGPSSLLQRVLLLASRKHPSERWDLSRKFPRSHRAPGGFERWLGATLMRALTYPPAGQLQTAAQLAPQPIGFDCALLITAGIRRLSGDTSPAALRLAEEANRRRRRFAHHGEFYQFIYPLVADLFYCTAMGLEEERCRAASAFRSVAYRGNGWLQGPRFSVNVFDTALTVLALKTAGVKADDPVVQRAARFLLDARHPDGFWSWAFDYQEGCHPGQPDTDDSGLAAMVLAWANPGAVPDAVERFRSMQERSGAFSTFGGEVMRPNWCWLSNTSRLLQGMMRSGVEPGDPQVQLGLNWLRSQQLADGSWVDGWCARYIYGTAIALEALLCARATPQDPAVARARDWLLKRQNSDGGWGETWHGAPSRSSAEHTGLALYALSLSANPDDVPRPAIERGIAWLLDSQRDDGTWEASYFIDFGFGVGFADSQMPVVWALHGLGAAIPLLERVTAGSLP